MINIFFQNYSHFLSYFTQTVRTFLRRIAQYYRQLVRDLLAKANAYQIIISINRSPVLHRLLSGYSIRYY